MNLFTKAASAARKVTMRFTGRLQTFWGMYLPGTRRDYARAVGNGTNSSVAMACLLWISRTFPEAPIRVQQRQPDGKLQPKDDHEMVTLIDRPNPYYSGQLLWMTTITDLVADGNAYWIKIRASAGRVVELWYVPTSLIEPRWPDDGSAYLSEYRYKPNPQADAIIIDPADVVHFRYGIDPTNTRKGRSPLATALREIYTDDEAANFSAAVLSNMGVPGVILSPDTDAGIPSADEARAVKASYMESFGGDNRGGVMVNSQRVKVDVLSWSPQQLNLRDLRQIPEERISALLGVPAIVAGLGAGLQRSTFANFREAREAAYESNIVPLQRLVAAEVYTQLLPDFDTTGKLLVDFDLSGIRILQEDESAKVTRLNSQLSAGAITVGEWRSELGYPSDDTHNYYLRPINIVAIPVGEDAEGAATLTAETRRGALATNVPATDVTATDTPTDAVAANTTAPPKALTQTKAARDARYLQQVERSIQVSSAAAQRDLRKAFAAIADDVVARIEAGKSAELALVTAGHLNGKSGNSHGNALADNGNSLNGIGNSLGIVGNSVGNSSGKLSLPAFLTADRLVTDGMTDGYVVPALKRLATNIGDFVSGAVNNLLGTTVEPPATLINLAEARATALDMDGQARKAVEAAITDGQAADDTMEALTQRIHDYVEAGHLYPGIAEDRGVSAAAEYRAQLIADTEAATFANVTTALVAREAGADGLLCSDGDGCGVTGHDDPEQADGRVFTFDEASEWPLAHPNCVRRFSPYIGAADE